MRRSRTRATRRYARGVSPRRRDNRAGDPTLAADAIRRIPTIDVPPFMMRLMWRADASPATLVFVEFVRATFGAAQLWAA